MGFLGDSRFRDIEPFKNRIWRASPTMHGDEQKWVNNAFEKNWITTAGENVNECERLVAEKDGCKYAVALSCGTAALHLAVKLAGEKVYGMPKVGHGVLENHRFMVTDTTFDATVNPGVYEGGEPVFIDMERDTWNMCPKALEKAFETYSDVRIVVLAHLYGTPAKFDEIKAVCDRYGGMIVEDAAESFGAESDRFACIEQWLFDN